jgi:hypothetical protein
MRKKAEYKRVKLQEEKSGQYRITMPEWCVVKVLDAKKGDFIEFDFKGNQLILTKR